MQVHKRWYALRVLSRFEKIVALGLERKGYEQYLPLYRKAPCWSTRMKVVDLPLFPGYVFAKFDILDRLPVLLLPGVVSLVGYRGTPAAIPDGEILALQKIAKSGMHYQPLPMVLAGQPSCVEYGPLRGLHGLLSEIEGKWRLVVTMELLQRSVAIDIDTRCLTYTPEYYTQVKSAAS